MRSWTALAWVVVFSTFETGHSGHMNRSDVFLHILIDLVVMKVLHSFVSGVACALRIIFVLSSDGVLLFVCQMLGVNSVRILGHFKFFSVN